MKINYFLRIVAISLAMICQLPSHAQKKLPTVKAPHIVMSANELNLDYKDTTFCLDIMSNVDYTIRTSEEWIAPVKEDKNSNTVYFSVPWNMYSSPRTATVTLTDPDQKTSRNLTVIQSGDRSAEFVKGDTKVKVTSGTASSFQGSEGIENTFDGNMSTIYHSSWDNSGANYFPITLTYNFTNEEQIDYMVYNPRQSGSNGLFKEVEVWYSTVENTNLVKYTDIDMKGSSTATQINFTPSIIHPTRIQLVVQSGSGDGQGFASCAEMEFFKAVSNTSGDYAVFANNEMTALKPEVTLEQIQSLSNLFVKRLALAIYSGTYSTEFRFAEYEAYPTLDETSSWMKTSSYNSFENPTGIYFDKGESMVILVDNPGEEAVQLRVQNFGTKDPAGSTYTLKNGINKITATNRGNGYISYYTSNYKTAPKVKIHFVMGKENGYFDRGRHTNEDWKRFLANACSDIMDMRGYRCQIAYPVQSFRNACPANGEELAARYDSIVYREHEIMGLNKYNKVPKNRQFSRVVPSGYFADGIGAGIGAGSEEDIIRLNGFQYWGIGHELGHVNQIRPGLKWVSTTEVTNNIYSAWVQFSLGNRQDLRLEHENPGSGWANDFMNGIGGRFNCYLNFGIRMGNNWLCQEGPDYYGQALFGTPARRNYDHFVKLVPMWQIQLYFHQAGFSPDIYAKVSERMRTMDLSNYSNGQLQLNFMRTLIDSTGQDVTDFFVKAGMLKPINRVLEDYSYGTMTITQAQCDELITYAQKYPKPASPVIYYISGNNWQIYKNQLPLEGTFGQGVTSNGTLRRVNHSIWKNVVAYETYKDNELVRITISGRGCTDFSITDVDYPAGSTRIEAIDWLGNKTLVYGTR